MTTSSKFFDFQNAIRFLAIVFVFAFVGPIVGLTLSVSPVAYHEISTGRETWWSYLVGTVQNLPVLIMFAIRIGGIPGVLVGLIVASMALWRSWPWPAVVLPTIATAIAYATMFLFVQATEPRWSLHPLAQLGGTVFIFSISLVAALVCGLLIRKLLRPT